MISKAVINIQNISQYNNIIPCIRYCNEDRYQAPWELKKRKIGDYEFIFITRGAGQFLIDGRQYNVRANDLILLPPNTYHEAKSVTLPFEFLCIHFDLFVSKARNPIECYRQFIYETIPARPEKYTRAILDMPEFMHVNDPNQIYALLKKIKTEVEEKSGEYILLIKSFFIQILCSLMRQIKDGASDRKATTRQPAVIKEILYYLETNYMNKVHLSDLSKHVHLEATYISKIFKKNTGCSITGYLMHYRLSMAKRLLSETNRKIDEIASDVGYYDLHHFSRAFKAQQGISPSQYRMIKWY